MKIHTIKSMLCSVLVAAVALPLLSACGSGNTVPSINTSGNEDDSIPAVSTAPGTESEAYVTMDVHFYDDTSGSVIEIPHIIDDGDAILDLNARLDQITQRYERFFEPSENGEWCEVLCYPCESDRYISLVISENTYPIYGTDGTLTTVVYDKEQRCEVTLEEAMSMEGISEDDIQSAFGLWAQSWTRSEEEITPDGGAATAQYNGLIGFRMLADNSAEYYISVTTDREMAGEWMGIYSFRDGAVGKPTDETGTQFLITADELTAISLEPPLWVTRSTEDNSAKG